jgi:hypothetical protein
MLYKFEELKKKLDEWGFPNINNKSGFQSIRTDFKKAYEEGKIEFREDGIYLIHDGKEWKGYMYMPTYRVKKYGHVSRFHLKRCSTIDDFIKSGMLNTYYNWSNNAHNDITDRDTKEVYKEQTLQLCSKCRKELFDEIEDTEKFFSTLASDNSNNSDIEIDIFGYTREWQKISKNYRAKQGFKCESCSIQITNPLHRKYLHTHHKDGDKTNNKESNLECLCILCHSYKDVRHEENFNKKRMLKEISAFVKLYRTDLERINNPYLKRYDNEQIQ